MKIKIRSRFLIFSVCAVGSFVLFPIPAQAYIDPSVMTYIIQAVSGIVIAVAVGIGYFWRRAKKKLQKKAGDDKASQKKEVEEDIIIK